MNHDEILALEHKTWDALCISGSTLLPLLSGDCVMVFPGGMKLSKESYPTLNSILTSEEFVPWSSYTILESEVRTLDKNAQSTLICYNVSARRVSDRDSQSFDALCSSGWRKIGPTSGRWYSINRLHVSLSSPSATSTRSTFRTFLASVPFSPAFTYLPGATLVGHDTWQWTIRATHRQIRPVIWIGCPLMTVGTGLFIDFGPRLVLWKIVVYQLIAGIGAGPLFQAPMIAFQNALKPENVAAGNAALAFLKNLATSLSLVIGGVVAQSGLGDLRLVDANAETEEDGGGTVDRTAFVAGLSHMWIFYTAICGVMTIASLTIQKRRLGDEHGDEEIVPDVN
ncbi:efflux pump antibiotic resistance protein [Aspergillus arachidicola]|uniref:Efflux pump antibiotic resistance protein n=1 Tax=Aspergillus arachidicola TaxID=656916 RepID=A0A2G7G030_9EURO|nr:efflux pump antibiotic resistance protein [Aspergillus arachidicola]